jgi:uncharacterized protein
MAKMSVWKLALSIGGVAAIAYSLVCGGLFLWQTHLIFFPRAAIDTTPADLQLSYEEVWISIADQSGDRVHGWWMPAAGRPVGTLLYLHGNGGNIGSNVAHAKRFQQLGLSVLLIDYRGYGRSVGKFPNETQVYQDAQTAWNYLTQTRQILPQQIFLYGHSLGGAIAIDLATHHPDAAGLIVESTFTSIQNMVDRLDSYRLIPVRLLLTQKFDSIKKVRSIKMPILLIHGTADSRTPYVMSKTLYTAAPAPKQLWLVPGAEHTNTATVAGTQYLQVMQQFLQQAQQSAH